MNEVDVTARTNESVHLARVFGRLRHVPLTYNSNATVRW